MSYQNKHSCLTGEKMRMILILVSALILTAIPVFANDGDLLVNGNVGIGTMTPAQKLSVSGTIKIESSSPNDGIMFPDGSVQTTAVSAAIPSLITNLQIRNNETFSDTRLDVSADAVTVTDGAGHYVLLTGVSHTIDCVGIGENGLDAGSLGNSTWYYVYEIYNPTAKTKAGLVSALASNPGMPDGYTYKKLIGCARTDGSAHFKAFSQIGNHWVYDEQQEVSNGTTMQAWSIQDCHDVIPSVSRRGFFQGYQIYEEQDYFSQMYLKKCGSPASVGHFLGRVGANGYFAIACDWVDTDAFQRVQLNVSADIAWNLRVVGFELIL
jgi:hypothetical protein